MLKSLASLSCLSFLLLSCGEEDDAAVLAPVAQSYVGRARCVECHSDQHKLWQGSHHDLAMQEVTAQTVLGNFDNATFDHFGVISTFSQKDGGYWVRTEGADGELHDYAIRYVFGVTPLQQYLIEFPGGRLQVLSICWDARPKAEGGQRWYHLYPDERISANDELHWTGPNQNWNYMCADCHSTDLKRNYNPATDSFKTTWSELDVSCEACHGMGAQHLAWAAVPESKRPSDLPHAGFALALGATDTWSFADGAHTVSPKDSTRSQLEVETCARCHARRTPITHSQKPGSPLLDIYRPALLTERLYHADGQILDEVYVYGSFVQSPMYHAGVTCSDCHEPHRATLRVEGNGLCARCHKAEIFDNTAHHFHEEGTDGALCVNCHMPTRTYMGVDERRDHSIRVPRPDLSSVTGAPDACTKCHDDKSSRWAADAIVERSKQPGPHRAGAPHYGLGLLAGRIGDPSAVLRLSELALDPKQAAIVRATALASLRDYPGKEATAVAGRCLEDADPLVRLGAVLATEPWPMQQRAQALWALLEDPILCVRIEAARLLATAKVAGEHGAVLERVLSEYRAAQRVNADRSFAHLNLGLVALDRHEYAEAERAYRTAIRLAPYAVQAYVNLADLYRQQERESDSVGVLREGLGRVRNQAEIRHALGLALVRAGKTEAALEELRLAAIGRPENPRYAYVHGVALASRGRVDEGLRVLAAAYARFPANQDLLVALITTHRDRGNLAEAHRLALELVQKTQRSPGALELLAAIEALRRR